MPKTYDGETIDIQVNMCGVYGRENAGQQFEMEFNFRSRELVKSLCDTDASMEESIQNVLDFLKIVSPKQYRVLSEFISDSSDDVVSQFMTSIIDDGMIYLDVDPGSDTPSLDTLIKLNERFPWIQQQHLIMPIEDSTGTIRYVNSRRPVIYGHIYYYRLKQHSEEKFSVTSLAATNLRNENSRNKASKVYKAQFPRTPIRFGDMELGDLAHLGVEHVIQLLMLYSASPEARMLCEQAMTGNPYNVDIQLEDASTNIGAEIFATYLKAFGQRLRFFRVPKKKEVPIVRSPFRFALRPEKTPYEPFIVYAKDEVVDLEKLAERAKTLSMKYPFLVTPFTYDRPFEDLEPELAKRDEYWKVYAREAAKNEAARLDAIASELVQSDT